MREPTLALCPVQRSARWLVGPTTGATLRSRAAFLSPRGVALPILDCVFRVRFLPPNDVLREDQLVEYHLRRSRRVQRRVRIARAPRHHRAVSPSRPASWPTRSPAVTCWCSRRPARARPSPSACDRRPPRGRRRAALRADPRADPRARLAGRGRRSRYRPGSRPPRRPCLRRRVVASQVDASPGGADPRRHAGPARRPRGRGDVRSSPCASSCSTRPIACSTWASSRRSTRSSTACRASRQTYSSPPRYMVLCERAAERLYARRPSPPRGGARRGGRAGRAPLRPYRALLSQTSSCSSTQGDGRSLVFVRTFTAPIAWSRSWRGPPPRRGHARGRRRRRRAERALGELRLPAASACSS